MFINALHRKSGKPTSNNGMNHLKRDGVSLNQIAFTYDTYSETNRHTTSQKQQKNHSITYHIDSRFYRAIKR